jgi:signal transduction histidine kinase
LSQEIVNSIAADNLEGQLWGPPLDSLINSLDDLQHNLLYKYADLNIASFKKDFTGEYDKLQTAYADFLKQVQKNIAGNNSSIFVDLLNAQHYYLQQLDGFTAKLTGFSNEEVQHFRLNEVFILCASLIIVLMEIRLIFLPAIKKIERQNKVLREISFTQSHIVRRPLANIQGLLTLTLNVKNQDPYSAELLQLAKKEADELDAAIKNNIHKSDKNYKLDT